MGERKRKAERARLYESPMFMDLQKRLATNVRRLRAARGWTQEECAHRCEMPLRLLQGIEAGTDNSTLITISRLVEGFEMDVQELLAPVDEDEENHR